MAELFSDELKIFRIVCGLLDRRRWQYQRNELNLTADFKLTATGPVEINVKLSIDKTRKIIELQAEEPFVCDQKKYGHMAVALNTLNFKLADGRFDLDLDSGKVSFVLPMSYRTLEVNDDFVEYVIKCSCFALDKYSASLRDVATGTLTAEYFLNNSQN